MTNDTTEVIDWIHLFPVESCMGAEWGYDQLWVWSKIYQYFSSNFVINTCFFC